MENKQRYTDKDIGKAVTLLANEEEGWPEETGIILEVETKGMLIVRVDEKFLDSGDDGLREIHEDYVSDRSPK